MAKCNFDITYEYEVHEAKKIITEEITENNGEIQINDKSGEFTITVPGGEITGNVTFKNNAISVSITDKPTLIPCNIIESVLHSYLE